MERMRRAGLRLDERGMVETGTQGTKAGHTCPDGDLGLAEDAGAPIPPWPRHADWQVRLTDYLRANHARPFAWGRWDCALFVAGAVRAMTGRDPMRGLRGYRTLAEGLRKARARGHEDHVAAVAARFPEIHPAFAGPGDIAVVPGDPGLALGIVQGAQIYVVGERGLGLMTLTDAQRAFRV